MAFLVIASSLLATKKTKVLRCLGGVTSNKREGTEKVTFISPNLLCFKGS